ncbi:hypothetical protein OUZ56_023752 [Daphnia magna]|uniref:GMP synthase n=1 Tax=Daphnia magna TaxID=35525 RepID=A0ABR0AZQ5_9CRUS|nr:hypothetical protein OUZ56_023752 [Daphnia magna]
MSLSLVGSLLMFQYSELAVDNIPVIFCDTRKLLSTSSPKGNIGSRTVEILSNFETRFRGDLHRILFIEPEHPMFKSDECPSLNISFHAICNEVKY